MATDDEREDQPGASPAPNLSAEFTAGGAAAGLENIGAQRDDLISSSSSAAPMSPTLGEISAQAAARARKVLQQLTEVVSNTDSVALLATLSSLRLTHAEGEEVDVDSFARGRQSSNRALTPRSPACPTRSRVDRPSGVVENS
jgi:hypothetical protein